MKLKLETQDTTTILFVTETIEATHLPVLKAGLTKLFQSGKKCILLDFTQVAEKDFKDPSLLEQIADLRPWAAASEAQLVVVSPLGALGHAKTREEGIQLLVSPLGQLLGIEAKLQAQLKLLEQQKTQLTQKLAAAGGDELKQLRQRNSAIKKNISEAERISKRFLALRTRKPSKLAESQVAEENLHRLVDSFLKQEGLIP